MSDEVQEEKKEVLVPIYLDVKIIRPDARQYKQQSLELVPSVPLKVLVEVPAKERYVKNWDKVLAAPLNAETVEVILTPEGLQLFQESYEKYFRDPEDVKPSDFGTADDWTVTGVDKRDWDTSPSNEDSSSAAPGDFFGDDEDDPEWLDNSTDDAWQEDW